MKSNAKCLQVSGLSNLLITFSSRNLTNPYFKFTELRTVLIIINNIMNYHVYYLVKVIIKCFSLIGWFGDTEITVGAGEALSL